MVVKKYKVGDKLRVKMKCGFHLQDIKEYDAEVVKVDTTSGTGLIHIRTSFVGGGYRTMFGYERELDEMVVKRY